MEVKNIGNFRNRACNCSYTTHEFNLARIKKSVDANDIITDPDYQRKYVYDDKRASCLIESILIGIPIPVIYLAEEDEGIYSVIDGQQRITSFVRYLKNEFQLSGLKKLQSLMVYISKNLINPCNVV